MSRFRPMQLLSLIAMLAFAAFGLIGASAQEATPAATAPPLGDAVTPNGTLPGNPQIQLVKVADGLADPVNIAAADDGSGRLFIVERVGLIRIVDKDGNLLPDPFLDISSLVKTDFLEQGLLGLAFHPGYAQSGLFYVYYSDYLTNGDTVLAEFHVSKDDPNKADPASERVLMTQDKPYVNHNGGTVRFGPDGFLYWSMGDGGLAEVDAGQIQHHRLADEEARRGRQGRVDLAEPFHDRHHGGEHIGDIGAAAEPHRLTGDFRSAARCAVHDVRLAFPIEGLKSGRFG